MIKQIPSYLLAVVYLVFGLNYFFHFIPMPPMSGDAGTFTGLLYTSKYLLVVKLIEVMSAILLLVPATRALGLLLIAPVTVNILLFELFIAHQPGIGLILLLVNALAIGLNKNSYLGIIKQGK
ncbi:MAG: DoxX protein [Bacteroidota bacterium]